MPVFVRASRRAKAYTRGGVGFKRATKTDRLRRAINKTSGDLGYANMTGNGKRARTLNKRIGKLRAYAFGKGLKGF